MQKSMKAEMEMAMKLLEKDVHHKQDTIVCLRDQLEDIKDINLEMYTKLSVPTTLCLYCAQWEQRGIVILTWWVKNRVEILVCDQLEDIKDINLEMYTKLLVPTALCLHCAQWEQRGML